MSKEKTKKKLQEADNLLEVVQKLGSEINVQVIGIEALTELILRSDDKEEQELARQFIEACTERVQELDAQRKRALADYQNFVKELSAERARMRRDALRDVVEQMLPVLDFFQMASNKVPVSEDSEVKNWITGVALIQSRFEQALRELGLEKIKTLREKFNPVLHEAIGEEEAENMESGTVLRETIAGFKLGETIIRPAKVITVK